MVPVLFSCDGSGEGRSEILYRVTFLGGSSDLDRTLGWEMPCELRGRDWDMGWAVSTEKCA